MAYIFNAPARYGKSQTIKKMSCSTFLDKVKSMLAFGGEGSSFEVYSMNWYASNNPYFTVGNSEGRNDYNGFFSNGALWKNSDSFILDLVTLDHWVTSSCTVNETITELGLTRSCFFHTKNCYYVSCAIIEDTSSSARLNWGFTDVQVLYIREFGVTYIVELSYDRKENIFFISSAIATWNFFSQNNMFQGFVNITTEGFSELPNCFLYPVIGNNDGVNSADEIVASNLTRQISGLLSYLTYITKRVEDSNYLPIISVILSLGVPYCYIPIILDEMDRAWHNNDSIDINRVAELSQLINDCLANNEVLNDILIDVNVRLPLSINLDTNVNTIRHYAEGDMVNLTRFQSYLYDQASINNTLDNLQHFVDDGTGLSAMGIFSEVYTNSPTAALRLIMKSFEANVLVSVCYCHGTDANYVLNRDDLQITDDQFFQTRRGGQRQQTTVRNRVGKDGAIHQDTTVSYSNDYISKNNLSIYSLAITNAKHLCNSLNEWFNFGEGTFGSPIGNNYSRTQIAWLQDDCYHVLYVTPQDFQLNFNGSYTLESLPILLYAKSESYGSKGISADLFVKFTRYTSTNVLITYGQPGSSKPKFIISSDNNDAILPINYSIEKTNMYDGKLIQIMLDDNDPAKDLSNEACTSGNLVIYKQAGTINYIGCTSRVTFRNIIHTIFRQYDCDDSENSGANQPSLTERDKGINEQRVKFRGDSNGSKADVISLPRGDNFYLNRIILNIIERLTGIINIDEELTLASLADAANTYIANNTTDTEFRSYAEYIPYLFRLSFSSDIRNDVNGNIRYSLNCVRTLGYYNYIADSVEANDFGMGSMYDFEDLNI